MPKPEAMDLWLHRMFCRRVFVCPECLELYRIPEALGRHLERHRDVGDPVFSRRGVLRSIPCSRGCGRHFERGSSRTRYGTSYALLEHEVNCDGSKPIQKNGNGKEADVLFRLLPASGLVRIQGGKEIRVAGAPGGSVREALVFRQVRCHDGALRDGRG